MNKHLQKLLQIIQQNNLDEKQKDEAIQSLKDADKELEITAFKLDRTEKVKHTTAILLEETIAELEQKRKSVESQNRELEIEAALERVRSRTLAMHHSDELSETARVLFQQFVELGESPNRFFIGIVNDEAAYVEIWLTEWGGTIHNEGAKVSIKKPSAFTPIYTAWKANQKSICVDIEDADLSTYNEFLKGAGLPLTGRETVSKLVNNVAFFSKGCLGVTAVEALPTATLQLLERFAKVFEQAYTRFLDLQKAEAQAREAQIEASLERVRASSMAMHKSDELSEVVLTIDREIHGLGIRVNNTSIITDFEDIEWGINNWIAGGGKKYLKKFHINFTNKHPLTKRLIQALKNGEAHYIDQYNKSEKDDYFNWLFTYSDFNSISDESRKYIYGANGWTRSSTISRNSILIFQRYNSHNFTNEEISIFKRFGIVFEQAYTRFLDLQKAEAQAREAEIQLALERVRARAMAMQHSGELAEAAQLLYQQFHSLGIKTSTCAYMFIEEEKNRQRGWAVAADGSLIPDFFDFPLKGDTVLDQRFESWKQKKSLHEASLKGKDNKRHHQYLVSLQPPEFAKQIVDHLPDEVFFYNANFSHGYLFIVNTEPFTVEEKEIAIRFANVFDQTYTRFLDLQKAEAQAREAQIEAGLERVRSRSMAMHKSNEVMDVAVSVYDELQKLDFKFGATTIIIMNKDTGHMTHWLAGFIQKNHLESYEVQNSNHALHSAQLSAWREGKEFMSIELSGAELKAYALEMFTQTGYKNLPEEEKVMLSANGKAVFNLAYMKHGALMWAPSPLSDEQATILQRFAKVFEQTYTRFLDLQKAEAQAREAQIETALERVRSRTIGMQHSSELIEASDLLFQQVRDLGVPAFSCGYNIFENGEKECTAWMSDPSGGGMNPVYHIPLTEDANFIRFEESKRNREEFYVLEMRGERMQEHYRYLRKIDPEFDKTFHQLEQAGLTPPDTQIHHLANFDHGNVMFITLEPCPEAHDIFRRFAKVFEQTYTRFLDLQKAEAQAREAEIQLALERVRARSMAMQKSNELKDVIASVFQRLKELALDFDAAAIQLFKEGSKDWVMWVASPDVISEPLLINLPYDKDLLEHSEFFNTVWNARTSQEDIINKKYLFDEKNKYYTYVIKYNPQIPAGVREMMLQASSYTHTVVMEKNSALIADSWYEKTLSVDDYTILKRVTKVFEQAYIRFLDLQKAEAQARESKIETALERVRSRSLAMHNSSELSELVATLFDELIKLDLVLARCIIWILHEDGSARLWMANSENKQVANSYHINRIDHSYYNSIVKGWKERNEHWVYELKDAEKTSIDQILLFETELRQLPEEVKQGILTSSKTYVSGAFNKFGLIEASGPVHHTEEQLQILHRFNKVFEQSYTRFLDLQKAEAQAREAQIEAALERVRARTMAMQHSGELAETSFLLVKQVLGLGIRTWGCAFNIFDNDQPSSTEWFSNDQGYKSTYKIPREGVFLRYYNAAQKGESLHVEEFLGDACMEHYRYLSTLPGLEEEMRMYAKDGVPLPTSQYDNVAFFKYGYLLFVTYEDVPEAHDIFKRFAKVFEQTYTRFLDLQKAEAQAQEARIEASLERVRSQAMAMHSSEDLAATIGVFYRELESLSITPRRCGVGLIDKEMHTAELSTMNTTAEGGTIELIGIMKLTGHPVLEAIYDNWILQKEYHPVLRGPEIKAYYQVTRPQVAFPEFPDDAAHYGYFFYFTEGGVYAWTENELTEDELKTYRRFTSVLSLTYKRYKDLKDAEAREKEAIKQAALDRVRADIASMRSTADLDRITPLIWKELTTLGIPFIRCGVFIMDEKDNRVHTYLSTPEGHAIAAYHTPMDNSGSLAGAIDHWRQQKVFVTHWVEADFQLQADILLKQGSISSREQYLNTIPTAGFYLHFLPFKQGMLYVGSNESLPSEVLQLVQSLAEAFSVAYARYEDFTRLELAKQQIEKTLVDLKQTQSQLVQSEKMASLGELTAGIAHEIQNPLNFVNNFSEVSNELIDEMNEGLEKGEIEEARAIAKDVKQNLEKINYHGKRAGEIVRSMLQHSRSSSGQKELTDMNVLCDEYLRLAYHGLRAKDKTFNAKFETHLDPTLPKVNVVPQDFGRVILNLINNAFYVVSEKLKVESQKAGSGFEPTVTVSTKNLGDTIKISIKDNGSGIPDSIKEKIFQPFFTTKPTGQGTGLGLSLSYDIVKAHGGEFKVETKEGEGSEFIITLIV